MTEPKEKDPQTGLASRHAVQVELQQSLAAVYRLRPRKPMRLTTDRRPPGPYVIALVLDDWKQFLHVAGLGAGETVLRELGAGIAALLPPRAIAGRLDGHSILILRRRRRAERPHAHLLLRRHHVVSAAYAA